MRILHVCRRFDGIGGIERYVRDLSRSHRDRGHVVDVLSVDTRGGLGVRTRDDGGGSTYLTPRLFEFESAVVSLRFPDTFVRLARRYDVVHFHYPNPIAELVYLLTSPFVVGRTVVTYHGDVVAEKTFSTVYRGITRLFLRRVDQIVATSTNMVESSPILGDLREKVAVIPIGIEPPSEDTTPPLSPVYPGEVFPRLLFVGRLSRYKGVSYLIQSLTSAPGHLVVVGDGPLRAGLESQSEELGVSGKVTFRGVVSEHEMPGIYREADILVLPSIDRGEGFGYVLVEAMAGHTALVTTELGTGTSYANSHGETGLVVPHKDADALAEAIRQMSSDRGLLEHYKESAHERFLQLLTLDKMSKSLETQYEALVQNPQGRPEPNR